MTSGTLVASMLVTSATAKVIAQSGPVPTYSSSTPLDGSLDLGLTILRRYEGSGPSSAAPAKIPVKTSPLLVCRYTCRPYSKPSWLAAQSTSWIGAGTN